MITGILLIIFGLKIYDNLDNKIKEILKDRIPEVIADVNKLGKVIDMKLGD